jgi:predicted nucleotidyltransferase
VGTLAGFILLTSRRSTVKRARELIQPYVEKEGVIGIYLLGSVTRPYRDGLSDYDIEVIVEDAVYERTPDEERQVFVFKEGEPRVVDYEFYLIPWSDFAGLLESTHDLFHQPYQHAVILHDPEGRISSIIERLGELPEGVRRERLTVHFLEFLYRLGRARKTAHRADGSGPAINLRLLYGDALSSLVKLLFLVKGSWVAPKHWSEQELRQLGIPEDLVARAVCLLGIPEPEDAKGLVEAMKAFLDECGETFHHDMDGIQRWLFFTKEGKRAFERWGLR